jgi:hypothetical protein
MKCKIFRRYLDKLHPQELTLPVHAAREPSCFSCFAGWFLHLFRKRRCEVSPWRNNIEYSIIKT